MQTTTLGESGLEVSRIALGAWQIGADWGHFDEDSAITAIRRALDVGINFFDTAQAYGFGASEHILGKALRPELIRDRDRIVIATKGGLRPTDSGLIPDATPESLRRDVDASLAALGIDRVDLYQLHCPDPTVPLSETAGALADLVVEGKIAHVGVANSTPIRSTNSPPRSPWQHCSRGTRSSATTSGPSCCPIAERTTSVCWSTRR